MTKPTKLNYVTAIFGKPGSWAAGYHTGIDYRAPVGTRVHATRGGKVIHVGWGGWGNAYGNHVIIQSRHRGRRIRHMYAHLSRPLVKKGQRVGAGKVIARSGNTGNTSGPHVHYEERVAPFNYHDHIVPVLPKWQPKLKKYKKKVANRFCY